MAREDYQKKIAGYALSTNSLLEKMLMVTEGTFSVIENVHSVVVKGLAVSDRTAEILLQQNDILTEIRDLLQDPSKAAKSGKGSKEGPKLSKLAKAGGLVALMGLGIITFTTAFKMAGAVSPSDIQSAIMVSLAMIPISFSFAKVIEAIPTSIIMNPIFMIKATISMFSMATGYALIATAIKFTPSLNGEKLLNAIAVAGVFYVVGSIFAKLLVAFTHNGLLGFFMNRRRVEQVMASMVIMAGALVVIGLAVAFTPRITMQQAGAFAIVSFAMIPLAIAFKQLKWVFVLARKFQVADVKKTAIMLGIVALAIIPLGWAATMIPTLNPKTIDSLFSLALIMIPISIIVSVITSAITGSGNKGIMDRVLGPAAPKPKKQKKPIDKNAILEWIGISLLAVGALVLVAIGLAKAAPYLKNALSTISSLDLGAMLKLIFVVGLAGIVVATIVNLMRGKEREGTTGMMSILGGRSSSKSGKMSVNDMIVGALALPVVALGLVAAAWIFQLLPKKFKSPDIEWTVVSSAALLLFSIPFAALTLIASKFSVKDMIMGMVAVAVLSLSILAVAYALSILPNSYTNIPIDWAISAAIALTIFALPVAVIGLIATSGVGAMGIILGVVGMIIIAAGILAVAWIFSYIPADKLASVAKGLTEALLVPINGIVDVLARIKNEIGIEALVPLAVGIIAISVSLITLAAATASVAAGGLFESIAGVGTTFFGAVSEFFGGKRKKGPLEILTELVGMSPQIAILAGDMQVLTNAFVGIIGKLTESNISRLVRGVNSMILTDEMMKNKNRYSVAGYFKAYPIFLRKVASGYAAIAKAQNSMDIQVLGKTTEMIKALAYLNEVGGDNAMAKLGDALINAVKELAGMLRQLGTDINQQTAAGRETSTALTNVANQLQDTVGTTAKPQPGSAATKATATVLAKEEKLTRADLANFSSDEIVDAIEELQRIIKSQRAFI